MTHLASGTRRRSSTGSSCSTRGWSAASAAAACDRPPACPRRCPLPAMPAAPLPSPAPAYRHFLAIPTRWMDNDSYGHVNNVTYYSYFDTAVNEHLIRAGGLDIARGAGRRAGRRDVVPLPSAVDVSRRRSTPACASPGSGTSSVDLRDRRCSAQRRRRAGGDRPLRPRLGRPRDAAPGRRCPTRSARRWRRSSSRAGMTRGTCDHAGASRAGARRAALRADDRRDARAARGRCCRRVPARRRPLPRVERRPTATAATTRSSARSTCSSRAPRSASSGSRRPATRPAASARRTRRRLRGLLRDLDVARHARRQARRRDRSPPAGDRARASAAAMLDGAGRAPARAGRHPHRQRLPPRQRRRVALLRAAGLRAARRRAHRDAAVKDHQPGCIAIVPAAGGGARFGARLPKQYADLAGRPVLARTLDRLRRRLAAGRDRWWRWRPDDAHYAARIGARPRRRPRCTAAGATRGETVAQCAGGAGPARCRRETGSSSTMRRDPACRRMRCRGWSTCSRDDPVGGLLAIPVADTLKRGDGATPAARDRAPRIAPACGRRRRRRCSATASCASALAPPRRRSHATDEAQAVEALAAARGLRAAAAGRRQRARTSRSRFAHDLVLAAAILAAQEKGSG